MIVSNANATASNEPNRSLTQDVPDATFLEAQQHVSKLLAQMKYAFERFNYVALDKLLCEFYEVDSTFLETETTTTQIEVYTKAVKQHQAEVQAQVNLEITRNRLHIY